MPAIGSIGKKLDLRIRQGGTFGPYRLVLSNPDGTPVDLTGCLLRGQIRRTALASAVAAELTIAVTDAPAGQAELGLSATVTAALPAGEDPLGPESRYAWDLELVDAVGRVIPLLQGVATVFREVTRDG